MALELLKTDQTEWGLTNSEVHEIKQAVQACLFSRESIKEKLKAKNLIKEVHTLATKTLKLMKAMNPEDRSKGYAPPFVLEEWAIIREVKKALGETWILIEEDACALHMVILSQVLWSTSTRSRSRSQATA